MNGKRLKKLREENGLTQKDLADMLDLTPKAISFYELGSREPSGDALLNMAKILNTTTDYLLGGDSPIIVNNDMNQFLSQARIIFDGNAVNLSDKDRDILEHSLKIAFMAIEKQREGGNNGNEESH